MEKTIKRTNNISDAVLEQLQSDITEIKVALLGNEYNPRGALYTLAQHDKSIDRLEMRINKAVWTAAGAGATAGFIIGALFKVLPFLV